MTYIRVTRRRAIKAGRKGKQIGIIPSLCYPCGYWLGLHRCTATELSNQKFINSYRWYNCLPELGLGIAYYIVEGATS